MYYLSKSVTASFEDAVEAAKQSLKRQHLAILAEIDLGKAFASELGVNARPYIILSACNPPLAYRAIELDRQIGSILLCNVVVQEHGDGRVEISVADPLATIGMINHVELIWIARQLRSLLQLAIDDVDALPKSRPLLHDRDDAGRRLARCNQRGDVHLSCAEGRCATSAVAVVSEQLT
jgi:uncharacterized protein (DUF302 family)